MLTGGLQTSALNVYQGQGRQIGCLAKNDQSREERGSCERSLAEGGFHSEALEISGSWRGAKALHVSEIAPLLTARTAEFKQAQSGYSLTTSDFFY